MQSKKSSLNRYRRGLETCPQAKTSKSGHAIFFFFSEASERRVRHRVENTRVHFWTFSPVSVKVRLSTKDWNLDSNKLYKFNFT